MMKLNQQLKICILVICVSVNFTLLQAQSRYRNLPRIKVNREYKQSRSEHQKNSHVRIDLTSAQPVPEVSAMSENNAVETETASVETSTVAVQSMVKEVNAPAKQKSAKKEKKKFSFRYFTEKIKNKVELHKVKQVDKTHANVPLILMIVFYVLGIILVVLALLMLYGLIPGVSLTTFFIVLILGILFSVAASVLLTLLKLGVF